MNASITKFLSERKHFYDKILIINLNMITHETIMTISSIINSDRTHEMCMHISSEYNKFYEIEQNILNNEEDLLIYEGLIVSRNINYVLNSMSTWEHYNNAVEYRIYGKSKDLIECIIFNNSVTSDDIDHLFKTINNFG